ncbi:MAG TPA: DUF3862 domain-containing protein [Veillonellaceae bacterium]|nr:DUF3862 domain-containing protein [Veillonellaceae bacterium]
MEKRKILVIALAALLTTNVMAGCGSDGNSSPASSQSTSAKPTKSKAQVLYEKFLALPMGASYEDVKGALGQDGTLISESNIANIVTRSYKWEEGGNSLMATFQNGGMSTKAMSSLGFLKPNGEDVTLAEFNQIQAGMNYDQVKGIFNNREGFLESEVQLMGEDSQMVMWINKGGSNVQISFDNGAVSSKSQYGLK